MSSPRVLRTRMWRLAIACVIACLLPALISLAAESDTEESPLTPYLAVDINPDGSSSPVYMTPFGDGFLCRARHVDTGTELWFSDGTPDGTYLVKDLNPVGDSYPGPFFPLGGIVVFSAYDSDDARQLWQTDGTITGTQSSRISARPPAATVSVSGF